MKRILIVDDDRNICLLLEKFLSRKGFDTASAENGKSAVQYLKKNPVDLVILDFKLPDYNGVEILQKIKIINPETAVIIITGYSDVRVAVDAVKKGAFEYVTKPLQPDEILMVIQHAMGARTAISPKPSRINPQQFFRDFVQGESHQSKTLFKHIELIAPTDMSVIILGETGTGKEYVAKAIHFKSKRSGQPFIAIDCGALTKELAGSELFGHVKGAFTGAVQDKPGSFELANGGTLFLDEISNLSYENQIKLLRVLQERKIKRIGDIKDINVDVRLIIASNENLKNAVKRGDFREDIYHRINEFSIDVAPLREKPEDIRQYSRHFLKMANQQLKKEVVGFNKEVLDRFQAYNWPGNLRELHNVIKRAVLIAPGNMIDSTCLPEEIRHPVRQQDAVIDIAFNGHLPKNLKQVTHEAERSAIMEVLRRTNFNKTETAKMLGIDRKTLYNKMKNHDLEEI